MKFSDVQGIVIYMQINDIHATDKMHIPLRYVRWRILDLRVHFSYFVFLGNSSQVESPLAFMFGKILVHKEV